MPPIVALVLWGGTVLWLIINTRAKDSTFSPALWVPLIWMFLLGSRSPSQWLGETGISVADAFEEGSPIDRAVYLVLIALAVAILAARHLNWHDVLRQNMALGVLLLYGMLSIAWSDFPFITLKRWTRDLGMYLVVFVVLSDTRPLEAISAVLRRLFYLLLSLSVVLIKYFPASAIVYNPWTGAPQYAGVTTSKNTLGVICLIGGLFCFSDTLNRWASRKTRSTRRILWTNFALIAMLLWLLNLSDSATSRVCLVVGCVLIAIIHSRWAKAEPRRLMTLVPVGVSAYLLLELVFDLSHFIAQLVGRDPTLTGRTGMWSTLLAVDINPLVGVGYQSFWLGHRLTAVWTALGATFLNQAHNGYLEMYLNLGIIGVILLGIFLASSYRRICSLVTSHSPLMAFSMPLWVVILLYNLTEATFVSSLIWCCFLLCVIAVTRTEPVPMVSRLNRRVPIPSRVAPVDNDTRRHSPPGGA